VGFVVTLLLIALPGLLAALVVYRGGSRTKSGTVLVASAAAVSLSFATFAAASGGGDSDAGMVFLVLGGVMASLTLAVGWVLRELALSRFG
jgi:hypothetical protein